MKLGKSLINPEVTFGWLELRQRGSVRLPDASPHPEGVSSTATNAQVQIDQGEEARLLALQLRNTIFRNS